MPPLVLAATTAACAACSRTPSPLTPNLRGPAVGIPSRGVLVDAFELPPEGPGFRWLRREGHHFGLARLVTAIEEAASEVDRLRPGGAPLFVGDLSSERGGHLLGHHSHRTGRDADLLFYAMTPGGEPVPSPGFVHFGADGLAPTSENRGAPFVRIDVEREWLLIRALIVSDRANIQWLFVSRPIEALLTEHARARGEAAEILWRAETVMRQPSDSPPHDDHLHLRTACLPEESLGGCEGGGPYWSWLPSVPSLAPESDGELVYALFAPMGMPGATTPSTEEGGEAPDVDESEGARE